MRGKDRAILGYLLERDPWIRPTEIGMTVFGKPHEQASSFVGVPLKRLRKAGYVERNHGEYRITLDGELALKEDGRCIESGRTNDDD